MKASWWSWRDRVAIVLGLVIPLAVCAILVPFRTSVPNTDAALVLVAAVVAVAANGHRIAGLLAAVSAAVWFDFLLTAPYETLSISRREDVETAVLLVVVGAAVTELAVRGRRSRTLAQIDAAYLAAIESTTDLIESGATGRQLSDRVSTTIQTLLGLRSCRFEANRFGGLPRLDPDGAIRSDDRVWDVDQFGLPDTGIELLVMLRGRAYGRFVLDPVAGLAPSLAARRCVGILARQVAAALAEPARAA